MAATADTKRVMGLLDARIAGPVASVWTNALLGVGSQSGGTAIGSAGRSSLDGPAGLSRPAGVRFVVCRTEDAMDSVIPCAAEELLRPMIQNRFADAAKLRFRYC